MANPIPMHQVMRRRGPAPQPRRSSHTTVIFAPGGPPPPICPPDAVIFDLGDWTKTVPKKGKARVQFSLLRSQQAVTTIALEIKLSSSPTWTVQDTLTGGDLRSVSGAYFSMPAPPKRYDLRVVASSALGCVGGSDRPFSVEVVP